MNNIQQIPEISYFHIIKLLKILSSNASNENNYYTNYVIINNQKYNIFGYSFLSISPILYLSDFSISANIYSFLDVKEIGKIDFHIKIMDTQTNKQHVRD